MQDNAGGSGVMWSGGGEDLNVNLVELAPATAIGMHVNTEVDVLLVGVSGSGMVETGAPAEGVEVAAHRLASGVLVEIPKGLQRSIAAGDAAPLRYLSVHRRRQLRMGATR
ncbi:MAG: cupin domain-containing protein [Actinomycetota bacterium]|nr:cupin domain-containing protein [Actinomycetota bacterium]